MKTKSCYTAVQQEGGLHTKSDLDATHYSTYSRRAGSEENTELFFRLRTDLGLSIFQSPRVAFLPLSTKEPMNRCILSLVWLKDSVDKLNAKLIPKDKLHFSHFLSMGERWQWWG